MNDQPTTWRQSLLRRKMLIGVIVLLVIGGSTYGYRQLKTSNAPITYTLAAAEKGTLIVAVSGTGQVNVDHQVDIKPKVSGQVTSLSVKNGDEVQTGAGLLAIDAKDANKAVRNAQLSLESARLSLEKIRKPADEYTVASSRSDLEQAKTDLVKLQKPPTKFDLTSAENALSQALRDREQAESNRQKIELDAKQNLQKAYQDAAVAVANAYSDMAVIINDLYATQYSDNRSLAQQPIDAYFQVLQRVLTSSVNEQQDIIKGVKNDFNAASKSYYAAYELYNQQQENTEETISTNIVKVMDVAKTVSQSVNSTNTLLNTLTRDSNYKDYFFATLVDTQKPKILADSSTLSNDVLALQNYKNTIETITLNAPIDLKNALASIDAAEERVKEKEAFLTKLKDGATEEDLFNAQQRVQQRQDALDKLLKGADELDIRSQELAVRDKENALFDAQQNLADYTVFAPFEGILSKVNVSKGDTISSATILATLITKKLVAVISLNEVDAAKISLGQKATMTFDAIENLTLTGVVSEIDTVGTVTQGVVTYNVEISFDIQDNRVKAGMSVSAAIVTDTRQDVVLVPNAAVKTQGNQRYVEIIDVSENSRPDDTTITTTALAKQQMVEVGIANDTMTEIITGLKEGDRLVVKTSNSSKKTTTAPSTGGFRLPGLGGGRG